MSVLYFAYGSNLKWERMRERIEVEVRAAAGDDRHASTYRSDRITDDPVPLDWYRGMILEGARKHCLPEEYLTVLEALPTRTDAPPRD
jgi:hypothetical protein